jgi:hypothetical protein
MVLNPKRNEDVGGFGGGKGATIWRDAMAPILEARGSGEFPPADEVVQNGNTRPVPGCSSVRACESALSDAGFQHSTVRIDSDRPAGTLLGTSPPRGGRAVQGQVVSILVSNGSDYVAPRRQPEPEPEPTPEEPPPADEPAPPEEAPPEDAGPPADEGDPPVAPAEPADGDGDGDDGDDEDG